LRWGSIFPWSLVKIGSSVWLVMMNLASTCPNSDMGSLQDFCVCIQPQSNLVIIIIIIIISICNTRRY
jgi:hypothetical protein